MRFSPRQGVDPRLFVVGERSVPSTSSSSGRRPLPPAVVVPTSRLDYRSRARTRQVRPDLTPVVRVGVFEQLETGGTTLVREEVLSGPVDVSLSDAHEGSGPDCRGYLSTTGRKPCHSGPSPWIGGGCRYPLCGSVED